MRFIYVLLLTIGIVSALVLQPYNFIYLVMFVIGIVGMILVGHISALRNHQHGIFAQWSSPGNFLRFSLNHLERKCFYASLILCVASLVSFLICQFVELRLS